MRKQQEAFCAKKPYGANLACRGLTGPAIPVTEKAIESECERILGVGFLLSQTIFLKSIQVKELNCGAGVCNLVCVITMQNCNYKNQKQGGNYLFFAW